VAGAGVELTLEVAIHVLRDTLGITMLRDNRDRRVLRGSERWQG
jgi:hypothetical protein